MPYTKAHEAWEDLPSVNTPINAAALDQIEAGVATAQADIDAHAADASGAHAATAISFTPTGTVAATTVQAAIAEVSGDVTTAQSTATDHINDGAAAHAATAIAFTPTGTIAATTVQAAIAELATESTGVVDTVVAGAGISVNAADPANPVVTAEVTQAELDAHTGDTSGAHAATAIAFTPAGTIAATTVQAAIEEVASEGAAVDVVSNVATSTILGRVTAGSGDSEELTAAQVGTLFSGTSFPGSPSDRQTFFRTDRDIQYFYDLANTRWLSTAEYTTTFPMQDSALNAGYTGAAANLGRLSVPFRGTYSILLTRFQVTTLVQTTNNGSNYWTVKLNRADGSDTDTQIGTTIDTSADTAGTQVDHFISPNVVCDSSARQLKLRVDKVSSPLALYISGLLSYRLVG